MKTIVVQKAVLQNGNNEILLLRRSESDTRRPLQWDLPGGMLDQGESLENCIIREIQEETNLKATDLYPVFTKTEVRKWENKEGKQTENVVFIFYIGKVSSDNLKLSFEHDKFLWVGLRKALENIEYYLHKELISHILENRLLES